MFNKYFWDGARLGAGQGSCIGGIVCLIWILMHPLNHQSPFIAFFAINIIIGALIWRNEIKRIKNEK